MSGQPYRYPTDPDKFRDEYLRTLNLRADIDKTNLDANKVYKQTGQLPAVSQMTDNRTTSELLADVEKLKLELINDLKPVGSFDFASQLVQRIQNSPLNADGSLLKFFAQRAPEIVKQLQKNYKYKIKGDPNDVEQFAVFIESMYTSSKNLAGSVKSYFDRPQNSDSGLIKEGDLDSIKEQYKSIVSKLLLKASKFSGIRSLEAEFKTVGKKINDLSEFLSSNKYKEFQGLIRTEILNNPEIFGVDKNLYELIVEFQGMLDKLPKATTILSLLSQLDKSINNKSPNLTSQILLNIDSLFPDIEVMKNIASTLANEFREYGHRNYTTGQELIPMKRDIKDTRVPEYGDYSEYAGTFRPDISIPTADYSKQIDYLREEFDKLVNQQDDIREQLQKGGWSQQQIKRLYNEIDSIEEQKQELDRMAQEVAYRKQPPLLQPPNESYKPLKPKQPQIEYATVEESNPKIGKRGRGRPKGSGINRPFIDKVDKSRGIEAEKRYVPFGRYLINTKKLGEGIIAIKRPSGCNIAEYPSYKVSGNLAKVFKGIVGGKILDFNDLNNLTKEEQLYLYKVAKSAEIADKLSIPTPSKDEKEKEFHRFEVMKGEILSGNDNKDLIRSFKALIMKLSRDGTLPKAQTRELLNELLELGY